MKIERNVGTADRIVRLVIGISIGTFAALGLFPGAWAWALAAAGLVSALSGLTGFCPLYCLLRLDGAGGREHRG